MTKAQAAILQTLLGRDYGNGVQRLPLATYRFHHSDKRAMTAAQSLVELGIVKIDADMDATNCYVVRRAVATSLIRRKLSI